eukprot:Gb_01424 [translate_table: standard]
MNSFKGYGKVDALDQSRLQAKRKTRRRIIIISVASVVLVAIIISVAVGVVRSKSNDDESSPSEGVGSTSNAMKAVCDATRYPDVCVSSLSSYPGASVAGPKDLIGIVVMVAMNEVNKTYNHFSDLVQQTKNKTQRIALEDCMELMDETIDLLNSSFSNLKTLDLKILTQNAGDVHSWLSASLTNPDTCWEGLGTNMDGNLKTELQGTMENVEMLISNSLAVVTKISSFLKDVKLPGFNNRRLLSVLNEPDETSMDQEGFPLWLSAGDRRLLQTADSNLNPNAVVASDGTGDYKTIQEAVDNAPDKSNTRYIIKVKKGNYVENVNVSKKKTNLMLIGDGMDNTVVTGSKNVVDGTTTFNSATFAAVGKGFIAQDIAFVNTAGAIKHQAVALRVGSDQSLFYRCSMQGYQDTLYAHSLRQFYRECTISGTVDFIFGNAAVVFQNCTIIASKPMDNQKNTITAQGRKDPNQNTGISIHDCVIAGAVDLLPVKSSFPTYLGRPWKEYSRTVIMLSTLNDIIDPAGWLEWNGDFALSTLYYGEYQNNGPGAATDKRVKWPGYRVITSSDEAAQFTVSEFIEGLSWLQSTNVKYVQGLTA